ncbi:hypothetical protein VKS41_004597 [Umbelopsis sp. WA50703]
MDDSQRFAPTSVDMNYIDPKREHVGILAPSAVPISTFSPQENEKSDLLRYIFESVPYSPAYPRSRIDNSKPNSYFQRKHSIANDETGYLRSQIPPPINLMRRGSAPQLTGPNDYNLCVGCRSSLANSILRPCLHGICAICTKVARTEALQQGNWYVLACPQCDMNVSELVSCNMNETENDYLQPMHVRPQPPNAMRSFFNNDCGQYNNGGVSPMCSQQTGNWPCVKLSNIPWDVSQSDIAAFFGCSQIPSPSIYNQSIHVMMDRTTGKTLSDAYIEFMSYNDMRCAIEQCNMRPLKGRIVGVQECTQEELLRVVFPKWRGKFIGTTAIPPDASVLRTMSTAAGGNGSGACPPFVTREEINSLLVVCRNYKLHFSRKCAERPFENIITVVTKYPWHQAHLITTLHRDHVYEMLKLAIDYVQIDCTLLERLVRAGIMCPAFTERQKTMLLGTSGIPCPLDIIQFLMPANCFSATTNAINFIKPAKNYTFGSGAYPSIKSTCLKSLDGSLPETGSKQNWRMNQIVESPIDDNEELHQSMQQLTISVASASLDAKDCSDMNFSDLDVSSRTSSSSGCELSPTSSYKGEQPIMKAAGPLTIVGENIWSHP